LKRVAYHGAVSVRGMGKAGCDQIRRVRIWRTFKEP
jgi:hypothetical protein